MNKHEQMGRPMTMDDCRLIVEKFVHLFILVNMFIWRSQGGGDTPHMPFCRFQGPGCFGYFLNNILRRVDAYTGNTGV